MKKNKEFGIYVHIPFCVKKCAYCDFLSGPSDEKTIQAYFDALQLEIESYVVRDQKVRTIYFGGGTPSSVNPGYIEDVIEKIKNQFVLVDKKAIEITIETNPKTVDEEKWKKYKAMGINRVSMGLQSSHAKELNLLGRIHSYEDFLEGYWGAKEAGFDNLSVDVMSALPGQTLAAYRETLEKVLTLEPQHISSYSLIVEEGTPFFDLYGEGSKGQVLLPDEQLDREMYQLTNVLLEEHGYHRYEISNYAREGYESKHNSSYWTRIPYLGFGLGASSFWKGKRYHNVTTMEKYLKVAGCEETRIEDVEIISKEGSMEEFMFLGLRMTKGISRKEFYEKFGIEIEAVYGRVIDKLVKQRALVVEKDWIRLTEYGLDVSNAVLSKFLL